MEVHPPEHGIHSWRDFFVHMGTICLGLLIAIGLEQSAEALHRRHEAQELREDLRHEGEQIISDAGDAQQRTLTHLIWLAGQRKAVMAAVWANEPMSAESVASPQGASTYPDDPIYRTAQTNGRTSVLSRDELFAYSDLAADVGWSIEYERALEEAADKRLAFERDLPTGTSKDADGRAEIDFSRLSREDLRKYLDLLSEETNAALRFRHNCLLTRGLSEGVLRGARASKDLDAAEADGARSGGPSPE